MSKYTSEFKQKIVELYKSGTSSTILHDEYGVTDSTIVRWVKDAGQPLQQPQYSLEFKRKMADLYATGVSTDKIRKEYGLHPTTVLNWVKEFGGKTRNALDCHYSPEFRQKMVELYISGCTSTKIHEEFGVTASIVLGWAKAAGKTVRNHPWTRRSVEFKKNVVDLYLSGIPSPQLGKQFGVADKSVRNWVEQFGEEVRTINPTILSEDGESKTCSICFLMKPLSEFSRNPNGIGGRHSSCKSCTKTYFRRRKYGMTLEDFDELLKEQDGGCAICGEKPDENNRANWHIDHDHKCCAGENTCGNCVRGILCPNCNPGLGQFKDSEDLLLRALLYLRKYRVKREFETYREESILETTSAE
jgi:transposase-like protein